ncbi:hypothetical protein [Nonomuraea endophytica]|uniref:Uncharacterized protein n=1 Tax=Nonomuraea endophytica TaxID=714136 RepID=A0A7W7ZZB1_9ACTN|nr:hypothetical protein [Nonomuraea endophytica]MBB5076026.1 hypothetical protein [Nonomuraea endophytica]
MLLRATARGALRARARLLGVRAGLSRVRPRAPRLPGLSRLAGLSRLPGTWAGLALLTGLSRLTGLTGLGATGLRRVEARPLPLLRGHRAGLLVGCLRTTWRLRRTPGTGLGCLPLRGS